MEGLREREFSGCVGGWGWKGLVCSVIYINGNYAVYFGDNLAGQQLA